MRYFILVALLAAPLLAQGTSDQSIGILESWTRWSRDTMKAWQENKVLHGNDLDRAKRLVGGIETKLARLRKTGSLEDLFDSHIRDDRLKLLGALVENASKQKTKVALLNLKSDLTARLKVYTAQRQLTFEIGGDLEAMRGLMEYRLKETKGVKPEKKTELEKQLGQIELTAKNATLASQWCEGVELRVNKVLAILEEWVEEFGGW